MNRRVLLILGAIFAALAAMLLMQNQTFAPVTPTEAGITFPFIGRDLNMTVMDIQAIRLRDPNTNQSFIISRDDNGNWTAPGRDERLDPDGASRLARGVVLLPYERTIPLEDDTNLEQFGFQPNGIFSIEILLNDGSSHVIAIGGSTPTGLSYYALIDDQPQVYLMIQAAVDYLIGLLTQPPLT